MAAVGGKKGSGECQIVRTAHPGSRQILQQLAYKDDIDPLQLVIIAKLELVIFRNDEPILSLRKDALRLQTVGAPPDRFFRQVEKAGESAAGNALLDGVGLGPMNAAVFTVQLGIFHHVQYVGVQHRMDDQEVDRIEFIVTEQLADRAKDIGEAVPGNGPDQVGIFA